MKVLAGESRRRAVAREIMTALPWLSAGDGHSVLPPYLWSTGRAAALAGPDDLLRGDVTFDVHAAREHGRNLILHGRGDPSPEYVLVAGDWCEANPDQSLADYPGSAVQQHERFVAWTRERGLGPENREPGAFGGWCPGSVIREREGGGPREMRPCWETPECTHEHAASGGWPGKLAREWPGDSRAPMGRSLARLGQRILDMLEGQASECQECRGGGAGVVLDDGQLRVTDAACPGCHGTGHNLRGVLPPVEWSPAVRRGAVEATMKSWPFTQGAPMPWGWDVGDQLGGFTRRPEWGSFATVVENRVHGVGFERLAHVERQVSAGTFEPGLMSLTLRRTDTRVCPRGEHRRNPSHPDGWRGFSMDQRINAKCWNSTDNPGKPVYPRWHLGEQEHARQRRERIAAGFVVHRREPGVIQEVPGARIEFTV